MFETSKILIEQIPVSQEEFCLKIVCQSNENNPKQGFFFFCNTWANNAQHICLFVHLEKQIKPKILKNSKVLMKF